MIHNEFKFTNRLIHASSPYLLQHAHNPVEWWEWCDEAFAKARAENKLVLVSIGYSACHWCHVMERECFEKEDTARIMNDHFICIKVDREERPDVDQIYMDAVQLLTGSGGWPLNCFTLPDGRPLHGGTYFPKANWEQTLLALADFYNNNQEEAYNHATQLTNGIKKINLIEGKSETLMPKERLGEILEKWSEQFDRIYGGFNRAPKFPMPVNMELFLQYATLTEKSAYADWVHTTLMRMADGGIYDQSGGGFARYSTDALWHAPHFEKMLYDNAQLVSMYTKGYAHNGNKRYKKIVEQTLAFIQREMTSEEGLFYSALDADSEGVEGKFYCWTKTELENLLGEDEPVFSLYYSVEQNGNWEHEMNILYRSKSDAEMVAQTGMNIHEIEMVITHCHTLLMEARSKRVRPGLDDKIIASWNAMMIKAYAEASVVFGNKKWLTTAGHAMTAMLNRMHTGNQLYRIYKSGKASIPAFSEDYAFICDALLSLYEAGGDEKYALLAKQFASEAETHFYDEHSGFYLFASRHQPKLVAERADVNDDVIPSTNGVMTKVLYRLGFLFDDESAFSKADKMLTFMQEKIKKYPALYPNWFSFSLWKQYGLNQLVVTGPGASNPVREYFPQMLCCVSAGESQLPLLKEKQAKDSLTYYLCKDKTCGLPTKDIEELWKMIE